MVIGMGSQVSQYMVFQIVIKGEGTPPWGGGGIGGDVKLCCITFLSDGGT